MRYKVYRPFSFSKCIQILNKCKLSKAKRHVEENTRNKLDIFWNLTKQKEYKSVYIFTHAHTHVYRSNLTINNRKSFTYVIDVTPSFSRVPQAIKIVYTCLE